MKLAFNLLVLGADIDVNHAPQLERLKALGYDPGTADGRSDKRTLEALNEYRKSLGLQPTRSVDRQAVAPLTP